MSNKIVDDYNKLLDVVNSILLPAYREAHKKEVTIQELIKINEYNKLPSLLKKDRNG